jgi:serine/threonine protein kinase
LKDGYDNECVKSKSALGTPLYMAPEILSNQIYSYKSDIWCLGVILYELLTGQTPFESENIPDYLNKIEKGEYQIFIKNKNQAISKPSLECT